MSHKIFPSFSASPPSGTPPISLSPLPGGSTGGNSLFQFQGPNVTANPKIINVRNVRNPLAPGGGGPNRRNKNTHFINPYLSFLLNLKSPIIPNSPSSIPPSPPPPPQTIKTSSSSQEKLAMAAAAGAGMPPLPPPLPLPPGAAIPPQFLPLPDLDNPDGPTAAPVQPSSPVSFFLPIPPQINNYQLFDPKKLEMWDKIKKDLRDIKSQREEDESKTVGGGAGKEVDRLPELKLQLTGDKVRIKKSNDENLLKEASIWNALKNFYRFTGRHKALIVPPLAATGIGAATVGSYYLSRGGNKGEAANNSSNSSGQPPTESQEKGLLSGIYDSVQDFLQSTMSSPQVKDTLGKVLGVTGLAGIGYGMWRSLFGGKKKKKNKDKDKSEKYSSDRYYENKIEFGECKNLLSYHKWLEKIAQRYDRFDE